MNYIENKIKKNPPESKTTKTNQVEQLELIINVNLETIADLTCVLVCVTPWCDYLLTIVNMFT